MVVPASVSLSRHSANKAFGLCEEVCVLPLYFEGEFRVPEPLLCFGAGVEVALYAFTVYGAEIGLPG